MNDIGKIGQRYTVTGIGHGRRVYYTVTNRQTGVTGLVRYDTALEAQEFADKLNHQDEENTR